MFKKNFVNQKFLIQSFFKKLAGSKGRALVDDRSHRNTQATEKSSLSEIR